MQNAQNPEWLKYIINPNSTEYAKPLDFVLLILVPLGLAFALVRTFGLSVVGVKWRNQLLAISFVAAVIGLIITTVLNLWGYTLYLDQRYSSGITEINLLLFYILMPIVGLFQFAVRYFFDKEK